MIMDLPGLGMMIYLALRRMIFLGSTLRIKTFMVILHNVFFAICYITLIFIEIKDLNTIQIFITYEFLLNLFCKFKAGFI